MQLQFSKNTLPYLRRAVWEVKNEEQTQEVKLTESLPDIGRILGAWGQPLIRSKEWRSSSMAVSGGVMAWILYAPEEGLPQCVETWIPFQMQWEFPPAQHDGTIRVACQLKGIDARSVSARKMMVRSVLSVAGEALEPAQAEWYNSVEVPQDVQLLQKSYPVRLLTEAGEKQITLDEELTPNSAHGEILKILRCNLQPEVVDQKIMADKVAFRGNAKVSMLCECEGGHLRNCEFEIPFSQYGELEKEYDGYALSDVIPAVTNLEADIQENGLLRLKAGLIGQYAIYDRPVLELVTDAYSTRRPVTLQRESLELPAVLDMKQETVRVEATAEALLGQIADCAMLLSHPSQNRNGDGIRMEMPGSFQILGRDGDENVQGSNLRWEKTMDIPADGNTSILAKATAKGKPQISGNGISGEMLVEMLVTAMPDIPMVTALELGEIQQPDENRASLILRRAGEDTLWDIAKTSGSTVEMIRQLNGLSGEPQENQLLLIPVT